jgi:hypothetical protein
MRYIVICDLYGSTTYFSILSRTKYDFRTNVTEHKVNVLIFSTTFVWNDFHFKKNSAKSKREFHWQIRKLWVSVRNLPHRTLPAPMIWMRLLEFFFVDKICTQKLVKYRPAAILSDPQTWKVSIEWPPDSSQNFVFIVSRVRTSTWRPSLLTSLCSFQQPLQV